MTTLPATDASKLLATADVQARLKQIKLLILDVDGIMTDGRVFWLDGHGWTRHFHVKDGYGIRLLVKAGIQIAVISGGDSEDVRHRMKYLGVHHIFLGDEDKIKAYDKIVAATKFNDQQIAFMGDDLFDIPVMERVGFCATVPHAAPEVKARANYVTETPGGWGAVREVIDAIRVVQKIGPYID